MVRNPEVVFVADLTRADAPALVMTTQCELQMKSGAEGSQMTAFINDLKVCRKLHVCIKLPNVTRKKLFLITVAVGSRMPLPEREEEKQRDHSAAAMSGVLQECTVC